MKANNNVMKGLVEGKMDGKWQKNTLLTVFLK
jgi:hypothetical protein